ncbi:MAG: pilus assembly protein PilM [Gammaproteobacteria bacterium]|nr:pilus assembly protein PilM [Gammaproteobacteria bacterium]
MSALVDKLKDGLKAKPRASQIGPIGLHFAEEQVHAVQLRRLASGKYVLRAWASLPYRETREDALADESRLKVLLTNLLGRASFRGKQVVTVLPPAMVRISSLNYHAGGGGDGEAILRLMDDRLDGSVNDYVIDFLPVRSDASSRDKVALVTASRKSDVVDFLESLRHAKLDVAELEVSPAALNRLIGLLPRKAGERGNILVINYGAQHSYLTLISGRRLLMDKEIDFGSESVIQQLAKGLDIDLNMAGEMAVREGLAQQLKAPFGATQVLTADDVNPVVEIVRPVFSRLVEEVRRACLYAASESQGDVVEQVYTFGSIARWPGADQMLSELARLPVASSLPLTAIFDGADEKSATDYLGVGPELAVATGLALRGLTDDA